MLLFTSSVTTGDGNVSSQMRNVSDAVSTGFSLKSNRWATELKLLRQIGLGRRRLKLDSTIPRGLPAAVLPAWPPLSAGHDFVRPGRPHGRQPSTEQRGRDTEQCDGNAGCGGAEKTSVDAMVDRRRRKAWRSAWSNANVAWHGDPCCVSLAGVESRSRFIAAAGELWPPAGKQASPTRRQDLAVVIASVAIAIRVLFRPASQFLLGEITSHRSTDENRRVRVALGPLGEASYNRDVCLRAVPAHFVPPAASPVPPHFLNAKSTAMLRYWTAGESHGKALVALIDGFPAGVPIETDSIDVELRRRQGGYGRGGRQRIETDKVDIQSGIWHGSTLGQSDRAGGGQQRLQTGTLGRFGKTAAGAWRFDRRDQVFGLDSGGARTGQCPRDDGPGGGRSLAKQLLAPVWHHGAWLCRRAGRNRIAGPSRAPSTEQRAIRDASEIYSLCPERDAEVKALIDAKGKEGDTLGGMVEVRVEGLPFGLGTHAQWDRKLDGRLAQAVMAVQAIKGVEIGLGFEAARRPGSQVHDPIVYDPARQRCAQFGLHAADEQRRRLGSGHDQRAAAGDSCGQEADQHAAQTAGVGQSGDQAA